MIWTGVALLSICRCCWMKTLPAWNCLSGVLMISCDLISIYFDQVLWISSIFSYGLCIHYTRYTSTWRWVSLGWPFSHAVSCALRSFLRGLTTSSCWPIVHLTPRPFDTCHQMSQLLRCWNVNVHAHVLFLLVVLSIECVLNLSYQLLISWVFKSESNQTQF